MLQAQRQQRIEIRIEGLAKNVLGHQEFNARGISNMLGADEFDVLHALHSLTVKGLLEKTRTIGQDFQFRVAPKSSITYNQEALKVSALAEAL